MTGLASANLREIAEHYRQKATECRAKADLTDDEWARQSFLETAEFWLRLGLQAARRMQASNENHNDNTKKTQTPGEENVIEKWK
jgi:hypothetical protein